MCCPVSNTASNNDDTQHTSPYNVSTELTKVNTKYILVWNKVSELLQDIINASTYWHFGYATILYGLVFGKSYKKAVNTKKTGNWIFFISNFS